MEVAKKVCAVGACVVTQSPEGYHVLDARAQEVGRCVSIEAAVYCARLLGGAL